MNDTAHIFKAGDSSLDHRVSEFVSALRDYSRVENAPQFLADPAWADRLGSKEDVATAQEVLTRSLYRASSAIKSDEMSEALAKGYLTDSEAMEFAKLQQMNDFQTSGQTSASSGQKQS